MTWAAVVLAAVALCWVAVVGGRVRLLEAQRGPVLVEVCRTSEGIHVHLARGLDHADALDVMAGVKAALLAFHAEDDQR